MVNTPIIAFTNEAVYVNVCMWLKSNNNNSSYSGTCDIFNPIPLSLSFSVFGVRARVFSHRLAIEVAMQCHRKRMWPRITRPYNVYINNMANTNHVLTLPAMDKKKRENMEIYTLN